MRKIKKFKKLNNWIIFSVFCIIVIIYLFINKLFTIGSQFSNKYLQNAINLHNNKKDLYLKDSVIICGNAPIKNKPYIDDFDTVVRVNCYRMLDENYIKNYGKKTDLFLWCCSPSESDEFKEIIPIIKKYQESYHLTYYKETYDVLKKYTQKAYKTDNSSKYHCEWDPQPCLELVLDNPEYKLDDYDGNKSTVTTGVKTLLWFISSGFVDITITGFTLTTDKIQRKGNKIYREYKDHKDLKEMGCCHDPFEEVKILNDLINNNIIKNLE